MKHTHDPHQARKIAEQVGHAVLHEDGVEYDVLLDEHDGTVYKQKRP